MYGTLEAEGNEPERVGKTMIFQMASHNPTSTPYPFQLLEIRFLSSNLPFTTIKARSTIANKEVVQQTALSDAFECFLWVKKLHIDQAVNLNMGNYFNMVMVNIELCKKWGMKE